MLNKNLTKVIMVIIILIFTTLLAMPVSAAPTTQRGTQTIYRITESSTATNNTVR